jgi:protein ImuB
MLSTRAARPGSVATPTAGRRLACVRVSTLPDDPGARAALVGALLHAAPRVTPVREHPRAWWADASGMERRGGDAAVAQALLEAARQAGVPDPRVGVAATCIAAAAATRERGTEVRIVPPGADARYLRRRALSLLPIPPDVAETLGLLGLKTCGELADLPAADVELRFGAAGVRAWRLARAEDGRWPFRPPAPGVASAETEFEPPIESSEPLRFVLPGLIESVCRQLAIRQRIPARLRLVLRVDRADDDVRPVRPARPTGDARILADLCRRAVEAHPLAGPVAGILMEAEEEGAERADQLDAFQAPAPDPGALHAALLPVFARWGDGALSGAVHHGAHLPGEHAAWAPLGTDAISAFADAQPPSPETSGRPSKDAPDLSPSSLDLCLRRLPEPRPVRVREDGERRPVHLDLQGVAGAGSVAGAASFPPRLWKTKAEGPERISGAWWEGGTAREYWRVESPDGWLGLVYRDAATGEWYLEGWYD